MEHRKCEMFMFIFHWIHKFKISKYITYIFVYLNWAMHHIGSVDRKTVYIQSQKLFLNIFTNTSSLCRHLNNPINPIVRFKYIVIIAKKLNHKWIGSKNLVGPRRQKIKRNIFRNPHMWREKICNRPASHSLFSKRTRIISSSSFVV